MTMKIMDIFVKDVLKGLNMNIGDKVKVIDKDSVYYGNEGVITGISNTGSRFPYIVTFSSYNIMQYAENDLEKCTKGVILDEVATEDPSVYKDLPNIVESGESRQFDTGAKRDSAKGKGRPLLISPLAKIDLLENDLSNELCNFTQMEWSIYKYIVERKREYLRHAVRFAYTEINSDEDRNADIVLAKLMEAGAEKKGERNWEKGMPVDVYLESALRHLWKWQDGQEDEDHAAAFLFNIMGAIHTLIELERGNYPQSLAPNWPYYSRKGD